MGGMKSGTGDVWDSDDEEDGEESEVDEEPGDSVERERDEANRGDAEPRREAGERAAADDGVAADEPDEKDIADSGLSSEGGSDGSADAEPEGGDEQPYVVRRMLKDKSVQFERDERLTLFVHDDVKSGEQELEAEAQELFGRDIPVFDIREAVYRAALRNRDDVVEELEEMGYTRE